MNPWLFAAGALVSGLGVAHSVLGERFVLRPVLARLDGPAGAPSLFVRRVLRYAWHITSVAWWGVAALVVALGSGELDAGGRLALGASAAMLLTTGAIVGLSSRGAHFAWPLFAVAAGLVLRGMGATDAAVASGAGAWAAVATASVVGVLALLHVYWALGGRAGSVPAIPVRGDGARVLDPGPGASLLVAAALIGAGVVALHAAGVVALPFPRTASRVLAGLAAVVFLARVIGDFRYVGLFKRVATTDFGRWDTRLFTPLCFFLAGLLVVAAS